MSEWVGLFEGVRIARLGFVRVGVLGIWVGGWGLGCFQLAGGGG